MRLLFANANPHLSLINYGVDGSAEVQRLSTAVAEEKSSLYLMVLLGPHHRGCCAVKQ